MLKEIQENVLKWPEIIKTILKKGGSKNATIVSGTIKKIADSCQKAAGYMKKVLNTAYTFLNRWSEISKRVYPSLTHSLYNGDYHELFAFTLLRYLYRVDSGGEIKIPGEKSFKTKYSTKKVTDIIPTTQQPETQAQKGGKYLRFGKNETGTPVTLGTITDQDLTNETGEIDQSDAVKVRDELGKINDYLFKYDEIKGKEPRYEVILKPTRGTKILLVSEPNVFYSKL